MLQDIYTTLGTDYPESHRCENCQHWHGDWHNKIYARVNGSSVWVGQCGSEEDAAPFADLSQGVAVVFTPCGGRCDAFELHPDVAEEYAAERQHYASLERDHYRETL